LEEVEEEDKIIVEDEAGGAGGGGEAVGAERSNIKRLQTNVLFLTLHEDK
jgi:hypothetical protein